MSDYKPIENSEKFQNAGDVFIRCVTMSNGQKSYPSVSIRLDKDLTRVFDLIAANAVLPEGQKVPFSGAEEQFRKYGSITIPTAAIFPLAEFFNDLVRDFNLVAKSVESSKKS